MRGQWSRVTYSKKRRLAGVLMQHGRISLDSDFDERVDLRVDSGNVMLELWERMVKVTEDGSIRESAEGGPDTQARGERTKAGGGEIHLTSEVGRNGETSSLVRVRLEKPMKAGSRARFSLPQLEAVAVDGRPWRRVSSLSETGPRDRVYVIENPDGDAPTVVFGDGVNGAPPPPDSDITASYRSGGGGNPPTGNRRLRRRD